MNNEGMLFAWQTKRKLSVATSDSNCSVPAMPEESSSDSTRAICIEPTLFDELMLVMKFRVLQPCPEALALRPRNYSAKRELALCGTKIKRPLLELRY